MQSINELCDVIRQTSFEIHHYLGPGHLEKVYDNALFHRLQKRGLSVRQQDPLAVMDEDGTVIGEYLVDLIVSDRLILEIKAAKAIADEHIAQILGYPRASRMEHGLLINFGSFRFQIKKFILTPPSSSNASSAE